MFSTFTGNSRRPRTVNLSGQAGNPFANTSWSPAAVSNATKTVSDAQADRERRQAERLRLKAAGKIQRTWRGHKSRKHLSEDRRTAFDAIFRSGTALSEQPAHADRLRLAFALLLSFFSTQRSDDLERILVFVKETKGWGVSEFLPEGAHVSRVERLLRITVDSIQPVSAQGSPTEAYTLVDFAHRLVSHVPSTIAVFAQGYFAGLASLCQHDEDSDALAKLSNALAIPIDIASRYGYETELYEAVAFQFLSARSLPVFENNLATFSSVLNIPKLCTAISQGYQSQQLLKREKDDAFWLLAHFIDLWRHALDSTHKIEYLQTLHHQLTNLASEISIRVTPHSKVEGASPEPSSSAEAMDPYIIRQLLSLVDDDGISGMLRDFSTLLASSSESQLPGTSLLAGLISDLMICFPAQADETRMKLFLEQIPTSKGQVPLVQILWHTMLQTSIFNLLVTEREDTVDVLRKYVHGKSEGRAEDQEWRIVLLFLELYIFVLRLSDDEDFLTGMSPERISAATASTSRLRACSLTLEHIKALATALKNTAFALHYNRQEISENRRPSELSGKAKRRSDANAEASNPAKMELESLRKTITTAMKMLYERDSRLHFLSDDFWLMTHKFDKDGFMKAVIEEEQAQRMLENIRDSSDDDEDEAEPAYFTNGHMGLASRHARMEKMRQMQTRRQRERRLAELGPKLEILKHMPFAVPFQTRVLIFRKFVQLDRGDRINESPFMSHLGRHHAEIRRGVLFEDAFKSFYDIGDSLKEPISITFVDRFGSPEAGIDGGGVTKEFLSSVLSEAFGAGDHDLGMFTSSSTGLLYPDPTAVDVLRESLAQRGLREGSPEWAESVVGLLRRFEFLGRLIGKCIYDGILVDFAFAGFFLLKWPSPSRTEENAYKGSVNDLRDMDEDLYRGLLRLKNQEGDISDLGIDFTISDRVTPADRPNKTITRNLVPGGDKLYVTNDNRLLYNSYVARHRLVNQPAQQTHAFLRGLRGIIKPTWLSMFNQTELQRLIGGDSSEIDIDDLRANTITSGLYEVGDDGIDHPTIQLFWKVMKSFSDKERRDVIKYVSSTPRAPLLGFSQLNPKFSIRDGGRDESRLPSTSTCVNLLKLPMYSTEETLREKLLYAVTSGAGFDLS